jgi:hypothetical protein
MLKHRFSIVMTCVVILACAGGPGPGPTIPPVVMSGTGAYFPVIPPTSEFDTAVERSDYRRLMVGDCPDHCRPGPLAKIHPRINAASWTAAHRDSGVVIARIISEGPYPKFNIQGRDTVYWAVVKRGDSLVSIFRTTAPGFTDWVSKVEVYHHGAGFFRGIAVARFVWSDTDDMSWGTCDGETCCRSAGIRLPTR